MDRNELKTSAEKISRSRGRILSVYPFFGRLIMRMGVGFEDCGTAYTDMRRVVFDPAFIKGMDDTEMDFLFLHELMHCVLKHCVRGRGKVGLLYNVACDIVVNSLIMEAMGLDNGMKLNGYDVMHLAPDGNEGREYTADAVYEMLKNDTLERLKNKAENGSFDDHAPWDDCSEGELLDAEWDERIKDAAKAAGNTSGIPHRIARMLEKVSDKPVIHWRQVLQDFIRFNKGDYTFSPPDRRFSGEDYFLPAFAENVDGMFVNKLWFAVDTSGSVNNKDLSIVMNEIRTAAEQIGDLSGYISFFDTKVSEPIEFDSCEELDSIKPIGGGGTSFESIFKSMPLYFEDELPRGLIIMTDGYASFPDESEALGVPVIWIIVKSNVVPPWGEYVKID